MAPSAAVGGRRRRAGQSRGQLTVITGCMFSGKTEELIRLVRRAMHARKPVQVFKSALETRADTTLVRTHDGTSFTAVSVANSSDLRDAIDPRAELVAAEEVQFFDEGVVSVCQELADRRAGAGGPPGPGGERLPPGVRCLVEVPLPGGGSLGVNSEVEDAFDPEAIRALQVFAGLLATALRRLRDVEALRQAEEIARLDLALQRVRNEALQMRGSEDWSKVLLAFGNGLRSFVAYGECGINVVDLAAGRVTVYGVAPPDLPSQWVCESVHPALREAMEGGRPVYRGHRGHPLFPEGTHPHIQAVLDVPFLGGTLSVNTTNPGGFSEPDIEIVSRFGEPLSEASRRLQDLVERHRLEEQVIRLERFSALGELSAGFCHNSNNILTGILGPAQLLQPASTDPEVRSLADDVVASGTRAGDLVRRLSLAMRGEPPGPLYGVSLNDVLQQVVQAMRGRWKDEPEARGIAMEVVTSWGRCPGSEVGPPNCTTCW